MFQSTPLTERIGKRLPLSPIHYTPLKGEVSNQQGIEMNSWSIATARRHYSMAAWSAGYFDITEQGELCVQPQGSAGATILLPDLVDRLHSMQLRLPVLVRFNDILHHRLQSLMAAFDTVMAEQGYRGGYQPLYPIKVNQQQSVVTELQRGGGGRLGLEAGSKAELLVVLGQSEAGGRIICNGHKDREFIRLALIGRKMGMAVTIVVEKLSELEIALQEAKSLGITPHLGMRLRLASISAGKWQNSGGERAKFGLTASQAMRFIERLRQEGQLEALRLLHVHLGSQIANIRDIQQGVREVARLYAEFRSLGLAIEEIDLGGGLGIDYEGSRSRSYNSINYSLSEYAEALVQPIAEICDREGLPHPRLLTESGRGLSAHHAVLISNIVDVEEPPIENADDPSCSHDEEPPILTQLRHTLSQIAHQSPIESYHNATYGFNEGQQLFVHGLLSLQQRATVEQLFFTLCHRLQSQLDPTIPAHREIIDEVQERLASKYFCNFSVFQSLPDIWGIDQIFPIMPIQWLDREPSTHAVLEDLTCDSDGRVESYVDGGGLRKTIALHALQAGDRYRIAFFLVGAYQEILGDIHNLFGDTHAVNVALQPDGSYRITNINEGDRVDELLHYLHFDSRELLDSYRNQLQQSPLTDTERGQYYTELKEGMSGYTYFEE